MIVEVCQLQTPKGCVPSIIHRQK